MTMTKQMLINTVEGQECRIAIVSDAGLEELYVERTSSASRVGNIYKAKITNVESAIQAAFVDFGINKNGFLHISDVHPQYFPKGQKSSAEAVGRKRPQKDRPPIQNCLKRGQEVIVQMTKEGIGTKGPTMTTYLSIPGRLLVMMPGMSRLGVSRKVQDDDVRAKARAILNELKPPDEIGFIVRTAGLDRSKREMQRDLNYLLRLWKAVNKQIQTAKAPVEIYQESDLVIRTIRDIYNSDIERIICDAEPVAGKVQEFLALSMPRTQHHIDLYTGKGGLFHDFGLEDEIEMIYSRRVDLRGGGSLVIDQTEALVAIDVNSGRFREHSDAETTAAKLNQEAAWEIARQLRLRDLGGVIVIDFIDMREEKNRRAVERALRDGIRPDRAKTKILRISRLGIVEMTRQRIGPSLKTSMFQTCSHCDGAGLIKSEESQALQVMRCLQQACAKDAVAEVEVSVTPPVANRLTNYHRRSLAELEAATGRKVLLHADKDLAGNDVRITCKNNRGSVVAWDAQQEAKPRKKKLGQDIETRSLDELPAESASAEEEDLLWEEDEAAEEAEEADQTPADQTPAAEDADDEKPRKSRRRGRRSGRKHKIAAQTPQDEGKGQAEGPDDQKTEPTDKTQPPPPEEAPAQAETQQPAPAKRKRRRRKRKAAKTTDDPQPPSTEADPADPVDEKPQDEPVPPAKSGRKRRRKRKKETAQAAPTPPEEPAGALEPLFGQFEADDTPEPTKPPLEKLDWPWPDVPKPKAPSDEGQPKRTLEDLLGLTASDKETAQAGPAEAEAEADPAVEDKPPKRTTRKTAARKKTAESAKPADAKTVKRARKTRKKRKSPATGDD